MCSIFIASCTNENILKTKIFLCMYWDQALWVFVSVSGIQGPSSSEGPGRWKVPHPAEQDNQVWVKVVPRVCPILPRWAVSCNRKCWWVYWSVELHHREDQERLEIPGTGTVTVKLASFGGRGLGTRLQSLLARTSDDIAVTQCITYCHKVWHSFLWLVWTLYKHS